MKTAIFFLLTLTLLSACARRMEKKPTFIKGVYGNPGTLLEHGYAFDSLGMNAVFVRSVSLNQQLYTTAREQGCKVFVEFPTLLGKEYLQQHPEAWPINEKGEQSPPADWHMGICPTDSAFRAYRADQLRQLLGQFDVDGIFLDYVHWHAQFETTEPILPETCFCDRCTGLFARHTGIAIPEGKIEVKAGWILQHADKDWRSWRSGILTGWVKDMGDIVRETRPNAVRGVYYCAWYPDDYDSALYRTLGIDVTALAAHADVLAPMLFHRMMGRSTDWVGEYVQWLGKLTDSAKPGSPRIWPIVQSHNSPVVVTPEEFRRVLVEGSRAPSSGVMMFSDQSLLQDTAKIRVMREVFAGSH